MVQWIYLASHGIVTVIGLFGFWVKIEHRLTKIETDVSWLKRNAITGCEGKGEDKDVSAAWLRNSRGVFEDKA